MKQLYAIMVWTTLLLSSVSSWAYDVVSVSDTLLTDSIEPEWYVAPEIPSSLRAPMRANAAASCNRVEAIQIFDIDSVLTEGTYYEYDDRGNVISTTVWAYASDGTMTGKSKNEYAFDAAGTQTMTAVYVWESAANDWKGTEKYEYIYQTVAGEKKMISNTSLAWLNGAWVADHRYTYGYDEAGREISYFEYNRNTTTNELQPVLGREQGWTNDLQTLEANYTAYANGQWTAGTKKEWTFDENGTQTMFTTFTMSNGAWVGSSKETWTYGGPTGQLTLHEKYGWANNDWSLTLQEETEYAGANIIRIENYTYSNGVTTGTKKEEYAFVDGKKVQTIVYAWKNSSWVGASNETWVYNTAGKLTLHEKSAWVNDDWSLMLQEKTVYSGANITLIENYQWINGVKTGTKKEETTYTSDKKTEFVIYSWSNGAWVNTTKDTWNFNDSGKLTLHELFVGEEANWLKTLREENEYDGVTLIRVENYSYANGITTGTKKETYGYTGGKMTETITFAWTDGEWAENTKETWGYTSGKQTLHEKYEWYNNGWSVTLREISGYDAAGNKNSIENYEGSEGVIIGLLKEEYTFNATKEIIATVKYKWTEDQWIKDTKNEVAYQIGDTQVSEANYTWDGNAWIGIGNKTETTTVGKKVLLELFYAWSTVSGDWAYAARRMYEYDDKGRNIGDTTSLYINATWVYDKLQTHGYDIHDNDTLAVTATWNGTEWIPSTIKKGTFLYTESGDPLLVETYTGLEGAWVGQQKRVWEYNEFGSQTRYFVYEWKSKKWANKEKREQFYDANNHLLINQNYSWKNNAWVGTDKYEYAYDEYGRQSMSAHYIWLNNSWYGISKAENIKDSDGVILSSISYTWSNNTWEGEFKYDYIYDSYGRTIEKFVSRFRNNKWSNYQHFVYSYDGIGAEKLSSYEYIWKNSNWRLVSMFDNYYDTDHKLREEENGSWDSSTGDLVSYSDKHYFYSCDPHFYTIRFVNYDGEILSYITTQEGQTPSYPGVEPVREGNVEYIYTFAGWTPELAPVTSDVTYTATFATTKKTYTITWKREDGSIIDSENLEYGAMPAHDDATKASTAEYTYTFAGWTPGIGIVTGDAAYTATFNETKNTYLVTFKNDDGTTISTVSTEYGQIPTAPTDPIKPDDGTNTYTFNGWTPEITTVTGDAVYTATFTATKKSYTITWKNDDGTTLKSEELEYGVTPTAPADPTKAATAEWTYTFAGWDKEIISVAEATTYTATYTATKNSYTVTWKNEDGSVMETETLAYGATPAHEDIYKESTAEYTYTFAGWTPGIGIVTGDASYTATFNATKNSYTITFKNGDEVLQSTSVEYGTVPTYSGVTPTKAATAQYTYTFRGWLPAVALVNGNATYTAVFDSIVNTYTVTFYYENGETILDQVEVRYGEIPSTSLVPSKNSEEHYYYSFKGWTPEIVPATENASYVATYLAIPEQYTITFKDYNGRTLQKANVPYGEVPVYTGETPFKPKDQKYTYIFAGWSPEVSEVTGPATYTATFEGELNQYTIVFLDEDGSELDRQLVDYGVVPTPAVTPTKEDAEQTTYMFAGWNPRLTAVTRDATYRATYKPTAKTEGINNAEAGETATKVIIDNQIFIRRGGNIYTIDGQRVQ